MKLKNSLAFQLLKVTFSFYVLITVFITVVHMYTVWIQAETYLDADLMKLGDSAQRGIVLAFWDLDYMQVDLIVEGLLELPAVVGIKVKDRKIDKLYGKQGNIKKQYQLIHEEEQGVTYDIGDMMLYSSSSIVFNRVKNEYLLTVINAIIKTLALWIIVLLAGKRLITKPLSLLTEANKSVDLENVETFIDVNIGIGQSENELTILERSFNMMVQRLAFDRQELNRINQNLESIVEQRTHELQETNDKLQQEIIVHKETAKDLKTAKEQAVNANQAKSEFLANMSHELRTPLNAILGFSELMSRDRNLSPEQVGNLETIGRSGEHLLSLINDVLELSKIEAGRIVLHQENFDLHRLLLGLEEMFRLRTRQKGLSLDVERGADVPQYIWADQSKLRQILINLLVNAVKFTTQGGIILRVNNDKSKMHNLVFEVEDSGEGIATDELRRVFDPFFQGTSSRQSQQGTGLGISISNKFVRMMGGELTVSSKVGTGTVFHFDVKMEIVSAADAALLPVQRVIGLEEGQSDFRLLVVEDDGNSRNLLVTLLEQIGFQVKEAGNGQEAVEIWEKWQPHLIWMDIRMPVMDGYAATTQIKTSPGGEDTLIIALTAHAFEEDRVKVLENGCNDFVRKPFRENEIFEMMQKHLGVRYLYEDREPHEKVARMKIDEEQMSEAIVSLSAASHMDFSQAVKSIDFDRAMEIVGRIRERDQDLADALAELLSSYRFDTLQKLFENNE